MKQDNIKPFFKWAGGKSQLLNEIRNDYPKNLGSDIKKYVEPFLGGGAVLFDIISTFKLERIYVSDINLELINTYRSICYNVDDILEKLCVISKKYISLDEDDRKLYYYQKRNEFNNIKLINNKINNIDKAVIFIFLNKTCYNGLYRVNKSGLYNVPIGNYKNPKIYDEELIRKISNALENVQIVCSDYRNCKKIIDNKTFVYIDPPYRPISKTSKFTSYNKEKFNDKEQIELAKFIHYINEKGAKFVLSNSDPSNNCENDYFFENLYSRYHIRRVNAKRMINSKSNGRSNIRELIIKN